MASLTPMPAFLLFVCLVETDLDEETNADHAQAADRKFGHLLALLGSNCFIFGRGMSGSQRGLCSKQSSANRQGSVEKVAVETGAHGALLSVEIGVGRNAGPGRCEALNISPLKLSSGNVALSG